MEDFDFDFDFDQQLFAPLFWTLSIGKLHGVSDS